MSSSHPHNPPVQSASEVLPISTTKVQSSDSSSTSLNDSPSTDSTEKPDTSNQSKPWVSGAAGVFSGFLATLLLHPLEVLKIRMQGDARSSYRFSIREVIQVSRQVGLYTGVSANALASMIAWGVFFGANEKLRQLGRELYSIDSRSPHFGIDFTSSLIASTTAQVLTNPLWLMKTRMSLDQIPLSNSPPAAPGLSSKQSFLSSNPNLAMNPNSPYRRLFQGLKHTAQTEGIRGLYKGFSASLLGSTHGAIMMCTYQFVKEGETPWLIGLLPDSIQSMVLSTYAAFLSKTVATVITYPTQVMRTAIQDHRVAAETAKATPPPPPTPATLTPPPLAQKYGIYAASRDIYRSSGMVGFYRGMSMQIVRASLQNVIVFGIYESFKSFVTPNLSTSSQQPKQSQHKD